MESKTKLDAARLAAFNAWARANRRRMWANSPTTKLTTKLAEKRAWTRLLAACAAAFAGR